MSFTILTSTLFGCIFGGVFTAFMGGMHTRESKVVTLVFGWLCVPVVIPIPFVDSFTLFGILIWLLLFLGAAILPSQYGLMVASVPRELRTAGNSFAQFCFNLFGYLPGPLMYGLIAQFTDKKTPVGDE